MSRSSAVSVQRRRKGMNSMANSQIDIKRLSFPNADAQLLLGLKGDKGDTGDKGDKGDTGDTGNGIASITHTGTSGAVKTYTITFTDGTSQTYDVTDGQVTTEQMDTAIDNAVTDVKSDINGIASIDGITWISGYYINADGAVVPHEPFSVSDYIPLTQENGNRFDLYFEVWGNSATYVAYYDAEKKILQKDQIGTSGTTVKYIGTTKNITRCAFVRLSNLTEKTPVVLLSNIQNAKVSVSVDNLDANLTNILIKPDDFRNLNVDFTAYRNCILEEDGDTPSFPESNVSSIIEIPQDSTGYLRVTGYKYYAGTICVFYDATQNVIDYYPHTTEDTLLVLNQTVKIPEYAKYFRFGDNSYRTSLGETRIELSTSLKASNACAWTGKKWVCVGDSLTEQNSKTTKHYYDYISDTTGISPIIMGVSGSGYANGHETNNAFYQRVSSVPTDADVVTIFGSFNDIATGLPLGSVTDTGTDTLAGCINTTIDNLFEVYPLVNLGIITPTPWTGYNPWNGSAVGNQYVQMIIDICKKRGLMFLDLYHCSELRPWQSSYLPLAYSKDGGGGTHPDETGHAIIAPKFQGFLDSLLLH